MAGVAFSFYDFSALVELNIGISNRLDENRSESFTILFCDLSHVSKSLIDTNFANLLRTSDSIVHFEHYYFIVMPYTDRYGTKIVQRMIEDLFTTQISFATACYPANGENAPELFESLHAEAKKAHSIDLDCLYSATERRP